MAVREAILTVVKGHDLSLAEMRAAMQAMLSGESTPAQIAGLAIALRMKGESTEELVAAAQVMREHSVRVHLDPPVIVDTCGTGGDSSGTFNVSTAAAIVVAACGVTVAKHGNRSVSSQCGSADLLEALGVAVEPPVEQLAEHAMRGHICFMFAPRHHPAMRHAAVPRQELGLRTFFNLLGPLTNPAGANHQLLGVYDPGRIHQMAEVLSRLGSHRAWVVHGDGGLDEISVSGTTHVAELADGKIRSFEITPLDFGMQPLPVEQLQGGDAKRNAEILHSVFRGDRSAYRLAVVLNAAGALHVAEKAQTLKEAATQAERAIDSGNARACLEQWIHMTHEPT